MEQNETIPFIIKKYPEKYPLVSVVIPCYNYGEYIEEALESVLNQTMKNLEVIIVNDGSTDPYTVNLLKNLDSPKTRIIHQENQKLPIARNNGIKTAKGKYICCLDADDKFESTYLEECILKMETEYLDCCSTWIHTFGDIDEIWETKSLDIQIIKERNTIHSASIFTKEIWEKTGGYKKRSLDGYEDWEFWITIAECGARGGIVPKPLFLYRKHGESMIDTSVKKHDELVESIRILHSQLYNDENYVSKIREKQQRKYLATNPFENIKNSELNLEKAFINLYEQLIFYIKKSEEKEVEILNVTSAREDAIKEKAHVNKQRDAIQKEKEKLKQKLYEIEQSRSYRFINKVRKDYLDKIVSPDTRLKIYSRKKR